MKRIACLLIVILIIIISCSKDDNGIKEENSETSNNYFQYTPMDEIEVEPELLFILSDTFAMIASGDIYGEYYAFLDIGLNRCFVYKNGELYSTFGEKGQAPGEFNFMGSGTLKINGHGEIAIFDAANSRVQFFSLEGELLKSIKTPYISGDFDINEDYLFFTSLMGAIDLIIVDIETGEEIKEYSGVNDINLMEGEFPPPFRLFELGSNGKIYFITIDDYKISVYQAMDSIEFTFAMDVELYPFEVPEEFKDNPQYEMIKDRIREHNYPCHSIIMDKSSDILWVQTYVGDDEIVVFDLFNLDGEYLKRISMQLSESIPIVIRNGKIIFFNIESLESPEIQVYDIGEVI